jgi:hypothetical protein
MDNLEKEMNEYLFLEFGLEGDDSLISETWPFNLRKISESPDLTIFEFYDEEPYFALAGQSLNYLPQAGMNLHDLMLQNSGAEWIGARDPVDLSVSRLGEPLIPTALERRRSVERLGAETLPGDVEILEGLFLASEKRFLGLFRRVDEEDATIAGLPLSPPFVVPFPEASPWRRLAWGVGRWLQGQSRAPVG